MDRFAARVATAKPAWYAYEGFIGSRGEVRRRGRAYPALHRMDGRVVLPMGTLNIVARAITGSQKQAASRTDLEGNGRACNLSNAF